MCNCVQDLLDLSKKFQKIHFSCYQVIQSSILLICVLIRCPDWQRQNTKVGWWGWPFKVGATNVSKTNPLNNLKFPKNCFFKVISHVPPSFSSIHIACPTLGWPFLPPHLHIFLRQSPLFWATHWALVILTNSSLLNDSPTKRLGRLRANSLWLFPGQCV